MVQRKALIHASTFLAETRLVYDIALSSCITEPSPDSKKAAGLLLYAPQFRIFLVRE